MEPIKFSEEYTHQGQIYYEPANKPAWEVVEFLGGDHSYYMNETRAERVFPWLEALGHEIQIVQSKHYHKAVLGF